jgi:hypothetical protein
MRSTAAFFGLSLLAACATPLADEPDNPIAEAVQLQGVVFASPHFAAVLNQLDQRGAIVWTDRFYNPEVREEARSHSSNTAWLLSRYATNGGYHLDQVRTWWKWNPWSSTVAVTIPLQGSTKLNLWQLSRVPTSIANTLVHERVHSFGTIHPETQTRRGNECDASYVAGDLAQAILVQGNQRAREPFDGPMCPALCQALEARHLVTRADLGPACPG